MLVVDTFLEYFTYHLEGTQKCREKTEGARRETKPLEPPTDQTASVAALDKGLTEIWKAIGRDAVFQDVRGDMERIAEALRSDVQWDSPPDFPFVLETLDRVETLSWAQHSEHEKVDGDTRRGNDWGFRHHNLRQAALGARDTAELVRTYALLTRKRVLLLTGPAGQGKTHTLVHEINRTLDDDGFAVGVLGQMLNSVGDLWAAIRDRLDWQGTTAEFLDKLENEAAHRRQRALIVIDALNETPDRKRWRSELAGMVQAVLRRPHLTLALSVRSDYLTYVIPRLTEGEEEPWVQWDHPGFDNIEPEALTQYFDFYSVKAPVAPPLGEFGNPLYVQLLAKSLKGRQLDHWLPSWLEVWQAWVERLELDAQDGLGLEDPSRQNPIQRTLNRIARAMLDSGSYYLPRNQANEIAREATGVDHAIGFLCSAGALLDRPDGEDEEVIEFGFERLSDTFFANRLLANLFHGLETVAVRRAALSTALAAGGPLHPLASARWSEHPLRLRRAGILKALCLAAPRLIGSEFPTLIPAEDPDFPDRELAEAFDDSLRWRSQSEEFGADAETLFNLWRRLVTHRSPSEELDELIHFARIPGHPFAMERILHPNLLEQESPGVRDALWSVDLVPLWFDEGSNLHRLVVWARDARLQGVHPAIALSAARLLAWVCAVPQKGLRQDAMKGLTRLLVACPADAHPFGRLAAIT